MPAMVIRHVLPAALLPGATGREDVFAEHRAVLLRELRAAVPRHRTVVVLAPARESRVIEGVPDPGAIGLDAHPLPGPGLRVTATVAVVLLRLAGWQGPIRTVELGADEPPTDLGPLLAAADLVYVACASTDGTLPAGAGPALSRGEARVHAIHAALLTGMVPSLR